MEEEGKVPNNDALLSEFTKDNEDKDLVMRHASSHKATIAQTLVERKIISFQDWEKCKTAYNKGYGIKFGELGIQSVIVENIRKYIRWRHGIIHSKRDMSVLNSDKLGVEPPIFANKDLIEKSRNDFVTFIEAFHKKSTA